MDAIACIWRINGISFTFHSRPASRLFPTGCEPVILDDCMRACCVHDVSCRIHSDPCPAVRLFIMIGFMLMLIVKLSNDPREPVSMCNHEHIMFSCFIIVGMARIERAFSPSRKERIPIFPSFRMALFSIINIKVPEPFACLFMVPGLASVDVDYSLTSVNIASLFSYWMHPGTSSRA